MERVKVCRLGPNAKIPQRATSGSVGYDIYSAEDIVVPAMGRAMVKTELWVEIPNGVFGQIAGRSGLANNHGLLIGGGVIDQDYKGELMVILVNHSTIPFRVTIGMRVAQMIFTVFKTVELVEVVERASLEPGSEGQMGPSSSLTGPVKKKRTGGIGSTGLD